MHFNFDKKAFKTLDYNILATAVAISVFGIITVSSATNAFRGGSPKMFISQIAALVISLILGFIVLNMDYNMIGNYYNFIYVAANLLLVAVIFVGTNVNGHKSWLRLGPMSIQPSEFAKLATIIAIAKVMEQMDNINTWKNLLKIAIYAAIPMFLIKKQPDTGTDIIFAAIIVGMMFSAGLNIKLLIGGMIAGVVGIFAALKAGVFKQFQVQRLLVFLHPDQDTQNYGYNAYLAKIAISSGKFFGKGLYNGELTAGNFIPYCYSDFIYSVYGEEFGFLGSVIILVLYLNLVIRSLKIAKHSKDKFGTYITVGIVAMIVFQIFENMGMDIGLMPVTGIPLPFMSYGGTSLITNMVSIALVLNVGMRRKKIFF